MNFFKSGILKRKRVEDRSEDVLLKDNLFSGEDKKTITQAPMVKVRLNRRKQNLKEILSDISSDSQSSETDRFIVHPGVFCERIGLASFLNNLNCCFPIEKDTWENLLLLDSQNMRERRCNMLDKHPNLKPHFRAVLLDWLIEVCELYTISRDTYYSCMDYIDRYLSASEGMVRGKLQLLGVTCLFIASKMEEVTPPPLADLVFITEDACCSEEILKMEKKVLETLEWKRTVWTPNRWLCIFLHMAGLELSQSQFLRVTSLLDLSTLHLNSLRFSNSVLAATSVLIAFDHYRFGLALSTDFQLGKCQQWMAVFQRVLRSEQPELLSPFVSHISNCRVFNGVNLIQKYSKFICLYDRCEQILKLGNNDEEFDSSFSNEDSLEPFL